MICDFSRNSVDLVHSSVEITQLGISVPGQRCAGFLSGGDISSAEVLAS